MARKKKDEAQAGMFDAPAPPAPAPPARSAIEQAIIEFAQRNLGRNFNMHDLESVALPFGHGLLGAGRRTLGALADAGVLSYEVISRRHSLYRITAVKP